MMITAIQFRRAQMLARAYGHEWGQVLVTLGEEADPLAGTYQDQQALVLTMPASMESIQDAIDEHLGTHRSMPGLGFGTAHTTGSGRLSWEVHESGAVDLWVRRPGATLVALRRLEEAARTAYSDVSEGMRAALRDLCGTGIEWGAADPSSTLKIEQRAREQGVCVLFASISSDRAVEIEEKTRWDVTSDHDAAELRHWIALREALSALGAALPSPRPEVAEALRCFDEEAANAAAQRKWFDALPLEDRERQDTQRLLASSEADLAAALAASILPPGPGVAGGRRARAG